MTGMMTQWFIVVFFISLSITPILTQSCQTLPPNQAGVSVAFCKCGQTIGVTNIPNGYACTCDGLDGCDWGYGNYACPYCITGGAIAGIVFGILIFLGLIVGVGFFVWRKYYFLGDEQSPLVS
jgi:hypothetical protein